jgi:hypothetical protein
MLVAVSLAVVFLFFGGGQENTGPASQGPARSWRLSYEQEGTRHAHPLIPGSPAEDRSFHVALSGQLQLQEQAANGAPEGTQDFLFRLRLDKWQANGMGTFDQFSPKSIEGLVTMRHGSGVEAFYLSDKTFEKLGPLMVDVFALLDAKIKRDAKQWQTVVDVQQRDVKVDWAKTAAKIYRKRAHVDDHNFKYSFTGDYVIPRVGELWQAVSVERTQRFHLQSTPVSRDVTKLHLQATPEVKSLKDLVRLSRDQLTREDIDGKTLKARQQRQAWRRVLGGAEAPQLVNAL